MSSKKVHPPRAPKDAPLTTVPRGQSTLEPLPSLQVPMWIIELPAEKPRKTARVESRETALPA
jgi:hypothetical protein